MPIHFHRISPSLRRATVVSAGVALATGVMIGPAAADIQDYNCWNSPSNSSCNGVTPDANSYCYKDAYPVQLYNGGSTYWNAPGTNWWFTTSLWYSPHCKSNWAVTDVDNPDPNTTVTFSAKVRRIAGTDGPYLMEHGANETVSYPDYGEVISPMVYSPDDPAQACGTLSTNDNASCATAF